MLTYSYYGSDPRVRRQAEALSDNGHIVEVIALRNDGEAASEDLKGITVVRIPWKRHREGILMYIAGYVWFFVSGLIYVTAYYLRRRYDLIYVFNMPDFLVFCGLLPKFGGARLILDVRDPMPELLNTIFGDRISSIVASVVLLQERLSHRLPDLIVTVNEAMRETLVRRGVDLRKIVVVHNLPDPSLFSRAAQPERSGQAFTLIYTGTISPRHHIDLAIEALCMLQEEIPGIRLSIVGEGPDVTRLRETARRLHVEGRVIFQGLVPLEKIPGLLSASQVGISTYAEDAFSALVLPTKVFEYLMVGIPVVCSRTPTLDKYVDERTVFYFKPGDARSFAAQVRLINDNPDLVSEKLSHAQALLAKMNWEREKRLFQEMINGLLTNGVEARTKI